MFCESDRHLKMTVSLTIVLRLSYDLLWIGRLA